MMATSIFITGGTGFIGRRLIESFSAEADMELHVLVRDESKIDDLVKSGVRIHKGDITKPETIKKHLEGKQVIIHCAALMSNFDSEPPEKFFEVNVKGTENMLDYCDRGAVKQFIYISTVGVYCPGDGTAISEDAAYGRVLSKYESSKKDAEIAFIKIAKERKIPFTILRPSYLYGVGMRYGWPETIRSLKTGLMVIPGNGKARLHLLNIDDLVKAVRLTVLNPKAANNIYNIAGPEAPSFCEIFDIISGALGARNAKKVPYLPVYLISCLVERLPDSIKDSRLRLLTCHRVRLFAQDHLYDISKARADLSYDPSVNVKDGFRALVSWCEKEGPAQ